MKKLITLSFFYFIFLSSKSQSVADFIKEVNLSVLQTTINELSGETPTVVNGATVTIKNRVSAKGNDMAADYIKEKLNSFGLAPINQVYKPGSTGGRNVYAVQKGKTNPGSIYIICGHYDSKADYCADDNLSGTVTVLEAARILANYCFENTIIYALWDEEETGLNGSKYFAKQAIANNDNIAGVLNIDMNAYDGDNDKNFDIDLNNNANSIKMKDLLLQIVKTYNLDLKGNVVNPGTSDSDHASFWPNYGALLLGECWSKKDMTPFYHSAKDRASTLNWNYYFEMVKLAVACIASEAVPVKTDKINVQQTDNVLKATNTNLSNYQWVDCNNRYKSINGANTATYTATQKGSYALKATLNGCTSLSDCFNVTIDGMDENNYFLSDVAIYPNPFTNTTNVIVNGKAENAVVEIVDVNGSVIYKNDNYTTNQVINLGERFEIGFYILRVSTPTTSKSLKLIKIK